MPKKNYQRFMRMIHYKVQSMIQMEIQKYLDNEDAELAEWLLNYLTYEETQNRLKDLSALMICAYLFQKLLKEKGSQTRQQT